MTRLSKLKISWWRGKQYTSPITLGGRHINSQLFSQDLKQIKTTEVSRSPDKKDFNKAIRLVVCSQHFVLTRHWRGPNPWWSGWQKPTAARAPRAPIGLLSCRTQKREGVHWQRGSVVRRCWRYLNGGGDESYFGGQTGGGNWHSLHFRSYIANTCHKRCI